MLLSAPRHSLSFRFCCHRSDDTAVGRDSPSDFCLLCAHIAYNALTAHAHRTASKGNNNNAVKDTAYGLHPTAFGNNNQTTLIQPHAGHGLHGCYGTIKQVVMPA